MRHQAKWLLVGLLCLPLWPGTTHGQSAALTGAFNRYSQFYAEGRYQEALPFSEEAGRLVTHEFGLDHPNTATLLDDLATLHQAQGRYAEAEPLFQRSLAIAEKALEPEHRRRPRASTTWRYSTKTRVGTPRLDRSFSVPW